MTELSSTQRHVDFRKNFDGTEWYRIDVVNREILTVRITGNRVINKYGIEVDCLPLEDIQKLRRQEEYANPIEFDTHLDAALKRVMDAVASRSRLLRGFYNEPTFVEKPDTKIVRSYYRLPESLKLRVEIIAKRRSVSTSRCVREALTVFVKRYRSFLQGI
jgi:hypothetical protein